MLAGPDSEKGAGCWTVRLIEILCTSEPEVPVTVMVYVPVTALAAAVTVRTEVPLPLTELGENPAVTPEGSPLAVRATVPEKPFCAVTVIVPVVCEP